MGKIIPFGKRQIRPKPLASPVENLENAFVSLLARADGDADEIEILDVILRIQMHLNSLSGRVTNNSIATGRSLLRGFGLGELQAIARNSTPIQWSARPGYFRALINEIRSRI